MSSLKPEQRRLDVTSDPDLVTTPQGSKERVDHYLGRQYEDLSRSRIETLIADGMITVDGRVPKPSMAARPSQRIDLTVPPPEVPSAEPQDLPLQIAYEDADIVVVDKAAGMVVHPAPGHASGTLVNALLFHCGDLSGIGGVLRPGIVHRLDKDTSGLLVAAKSQLAHMRLTDALKSRTVHRTYACVVWGHPEPETGTLDAWIGRSRRDRKKMAAYSERKPAMERRWGRPGEEEEMRALLDEEPDEFEDDADPPGDEPDAPSADPIRPEGVPGHARHAVTHYETVVRYDIASHLVCRLKTGRTHQIRVHLAGRGYPVVADAVYGGDRAAIKGLISEQRQRARAVLDVMGRQALHAARLAFTHPVTGEPMEFSSELPEDMQALIRKLASGGA